METEEDVIVTYNYDIHILYIHITIVTYYNAIHILYIYILQL